MEVAPQSEPLYFELSWAILSSIGLLNILFGFMVIGIVGLTPIALVPIVVSAACALANGMCYYAFYTDYPTSSTVVASAFADIFWMVQEAGLSFYSYAILRKVLFHRTRRVFVSSFWILMTGIVGFRVSILIYRTRFLLSRQDEPRLQTLINRLHVGYFVSIALVECASSAMLLLKFRSARNISVRAALQGGSGVLFSYLMRSTELRLAMLAAIGVSRAATYSFQASVQSATSVASQLDRFVYTTECMFPVLMFIDLLASRLVADSQNSHGSSHARDTRSVHKGGHFTQTTIEEFKLYPVANIERHIEVAGGTPKPPRSSSQENIIGQVASHSSTPSDVEEESPGRFPGVQPGGINKTVEFNVHRAD